MITHTIAVQPCHQHTQNPVEYIAVQFPISFITPYPSMVVTSDLPYCVAFSISAYHLQEGCPRSNFSWNFFWSSRNWALTLSTRAACGHLGAGARAVHRFLQIDHLRLVRVILLALPVADRSLAYPTSYRSLKLRHYPLPARVVQVESKPITRL